MLRGLQRWVEVVVEQALYERLTAPYADLIEDVGEVVLHRVLGDAEHSGNLLGRGASYYQLYDLLLSVAKPISGGFDPGDFFWPGGFYDDQHLARMFGTCFCEGTLQCQPTTGAGLDAQTWDAGSTRSVSGFDALLTAPATEVSATGRSPSAIRAAGFLVLRVGIRPSPVAFVHASAFPDGGFVPAASHSPIASMYFRRFAPSGSRPVMAGMSKTSPFGGCIHPERRIRLLS